MLATASGALVSAPAAATVRFQGPLLDYGQVVILEPAPDVLFVLAGLGQVLVTTAFMGATFGLVWARIGYAFTRGQRDFSSVTQVVATKYEVLVENKHASRARELLAGLPGALPDPFA